MSWTQDSIPSTHSTPRRLAPAAFGAALLLSLCPAGPAASRGLDYQVEAVYPGVYPAQCADDAPGVTGLCVLTSVQPDATDAFSVYSTRTGEDAGGAGANTVAFYAPGLYDVYAYNIPNGARARVRAGEVVEVMTGTLELRTGWSADVQSGFDRDLDDGCDFAQTFETLGPGTHALMPGTYVLDFGSFQPNTCAANEVEVTIEAGMVTVVQQYR
jgi:hypothetical protein